MDKTLGQQLAFYFFLSPTAVHEAHLTRDQVAEILDKQIIPALCEIYSKMDHKVLEENQRLKVALTTIRDSAARQLPEQDDTDL